jgi:hypothetical protein
MAKAPAWRPFHAVFMERVIKVAEVQRHRSNADDEGAKQFFDSGRRPGLHGDYRWRVDIPPTASPRWVGRPTPPPLAANVQAGWDAAMPYYRSFIADLFNGVLIAEASHWMSGMRREFAPAEWQQPRLVVDVFRGDLFVGLAAGATWKAIALCSQEAPQAGQPEPMVAKPKRKPGLGGIFWNRLWDFARDYRDKVGGVQHLPADRKEMAALVLNESRRLGRPNLRSEELSRNIIGPLYAGKEERLVRTREQRKKSKKHMQRKRR